MIFFPDFKETWIFSTDFQKILKYKIHENPSSRSQVVQCRWTDMTQLIVTFRNCANMPKNHKDPWRDQRHYTKIFKILNTTDTTVQKTVNQCHGFKLVNKPRNINVLFNQCGSQWHGSASAHQKWQSFEKCHTVEPWIASIIRSRNVLVIQNTRISKWIFP